MGCTACIRIRRIHLFHEYVVNNSSTEKEKKRQRKEIVLKLKQQFHCGFATSVKFLDRYYLEVPLEDTHSNHPIGSDAGIAQQLNQKIIDKIHELVKNGETDSYSIRKTLKDYVNHDLLVNASVKPTQFDRAYYPSLKDVQNHVYIAVKKKIYDLLDQENLKEKINEWKKEGNHNFVFREGTKPDDNDDIGEQSQSTRFLFVHQEKWQRDLLKRYGNHVCLLDATYKTTMYALPLFFVCVKTNVDYQVVAEFIIENETGDSISEALRIIYSWNNDFWAPRFFMTDYSEAEINAIEDVFDNCTVYICDFHREQAWVRWIKRKDHNLSLEEQKQLLDMFRNIAYAQTRDDFETYVTQLKDSVVWSNQHVKRYMETTWFPVSHRWARAFRSEDYDINVHTNNGIEAQNKTLKYTYLARKPNKTLTSIVTTVIEEFLKGNKESYDNANSRCLSTYRAYHNSVPGFLHNRPRKVVKHCLNRINEAENDFSANDITMLRNSDEEDDRQTYLVNSSSDKSVSYAVDIALPSCQCKDWLKTRLPCKHMFAIIRNTNETWISIQAKYREGVYMTLDVNGIDTDTTKEAEGEDDYGTLAGVSTIIEEQQEVPPPATNQPAASLDLTKQRREVLLKLDELKTSTYLCENTATLSFAIDAIETVNNRMKATIPRSTEGIVLEIVHNQQAHVRDRKRCATGEALELLKRNRGCPYQTILKAIEDRYGKPIQVAQHCIEQLTNGPKINNGDNVALLNFGEQLHTATTVLKGDYEKEISVATNMRKLVNRLPFDMISKWQNENYKITEGGRCARLVDVAAFVKRHAAIRNDPVFGTQRKDTKQPERRLAPTVKAKPSTLASTFVEKEPANKGSCGCEICGGKAHNLTKCPVILRCDKVAVRRQYAASYSYCFNCGQARPGHGSSTCPTLPACKQCTAPHLDILHLDRKPTRTPGHVAPKRDGTSSSTTPSNTTPTADGPAKAGNKAANVTSAGVSTMSTHVLLNIIPVVITSENGRSPRRMHS
ncbi:hypothetical protein QZH41_003744 [Actinostola sp. cb2023]|nr:hypothetical protein QZH41_003744 [Actinostola sp. cb2023]